MSKYEFSVSEGGRLSVHFEVDGVPVILRLPRNAGAAHRSAQHSDEVFSVGLTEAVDRYFASTEIEPNQADEDDQ